MSTTETAGGWIGELGIATSAILAAVLAPRAVVALSGPSGLLRDSLFAACVVLGLIGMLFSAVNSASLETRENRGRFAIGTLVFSALMVGATAFVVWDAIMIGAVFLPLWLVFGIGVPVLFSRLSERPEVLFERLGTQVLVIGGYLFCASVSYWMFFYFWKG